MAALIPTYLYDYEQEKWVCNWKKVGDYTSTARFPRSAFKRERLPDGEYYQRCADRAGCLERLASSGQNTRRYKQQWVLLNGKMMCRFCDDKKCADDFRTAACLNSKRTHR